MPEPGYFLNPNWWAMTMPGNESARAVWSGLQMLAPNTASLLSGEPAPPLPDLPATPGKVPSTDDPRIVGAMGEAANLGINFLPMPVAGIAGAGRGILGLMRRATPELVESLASRSPFMYNPPVKSLRPFTADYPSGAPADASGRLTADIEGRPLVGRYVVGRKVVGGEDVSLPASEYDALTTAGTGKPSTQVAAGVIKGNAGAIVLNRSSGRPIEVLLNRNLPADKAPLVHGHEIGHVIDQLAGQIPTQGLLGELKPVYNTLNNPNRAGAEAASWGKPVTPQVLGYKADVIPREYLAEAIRAYMADPNYLKTVAPTTAAAIRAAVNANPRLSRIVQFNTIGGLAAMNGIDAGSLPIPKAQPPIFPQ